MVPSRGVHAPAHRQSSWGLFYALALLLVSAQGFLLPPAGLMPKPSGLQGRTQLLRPPHVGLSKAPALISTRNCIQRSPTAVRAAQDHQQSEVGKLPRAVVIVPGYALDASLYRPLQASLISRGVPCWVVPIRAYMWAPTFGGRSIRPILDRVHECVLSVALASRPLPPMLPTQGQGEGGYTWTTFTQEMANPEQGARPDVCSSFPSSSVDLSGQRRYDVALVGHSAGGWVSRLYLSNAAYDGMVYNGVRLVDTLVTLGSPHVFPPRLRSSPSKDVPYALRNLKFVTEQCGGWEDRVRCLCVGSSAVRAGTILNGLVKDWASSSYELCGYDVALPEDRDEAGLLLGDGITPIESALGLPHAHTLALQDVLHGPDPPEGSLWYGSDPEPLESWLPFILETHEGKAAGSVTQGRGGDRRPHDTPLTANASME